MADISEQQLETLRRFTDLMESANRELDPVAQANKLAAQNAKALAKEMEDLKKQTKNSLGDLLKATANAGNSTAKYGQAIEAASSATGQLTGKFIGAVTGFNMLGKAIGGVISIFGQLASTSLKQNDALMKTYQDLGKFGANSSSNFRELLDNLQRAGFNSENAEGFVTALKKVSPELSMFGSATGAGAKKLTDVFTYTLGETEKRLMRFGYTTEEMFDYTASYIAQQTMTGASRLKTDKQLNQEANVYMQTLAELSVLTGAQRDELDKNRRAQENDLRYQYTLRKLEMSGREEDREQARKTRLQVDYYNSIGAKEVAEGFKSIVANQGRVTDQVAAELQFMVGNEGIGMMVNATKQGGDAIVNMADLVKKLGPMAGRSLANMENVFLAGNDNLKGVMAGMAAYNIMLRGESVDREKLIAELRKIETQGNNDRIEATGQRKINERKLNNTLEDVTFSVGDTVVPAMTKLSDITNTLASTFAKAVKVISFGNLDYTKQFESSADVLRNSKVDLDKFGESTKKIAELEEKRKNAVKGSEEELKITKELGKLKGEQRSTAQRLMEANNRSQQLGGQGFLKGPLLEQLGGIVTNPDADIARGADVDKLFTFTSGTGSRERFDQLDRDLKTKLIAAATDYSAATGGKKLIINSGKRSLEEQQKLYDDYTSGKSKIPAAPPGQSKHQLGQAVDIQNYTDPAALKALQRAGLFQKYGSKDPVHFEGAYNGAIFKGPKTGYWARLHGTEGVFNMKQMANLSNALTRNPFQSNTMNTASSNIMDYVSSVLEKLDSLVDLQSRIARAGEEHLQYTKSN